MVEMLVSNIAAARVAVLFTCATPVSAILASSLRLPPCSTVSSSPIRFSSGSAEGRVSSDASSLTVSNVSVPV